MKMWKLILPVTATLLVAGLANAQSDEETKQRETAAKKAEYSERLREAEERMELAAREIAEITRERLPKMVQLERRFEFSNKPRLGITIDGDDKSGPVEGVEIDGVTPGTAADDSGMRAGDIITAINGESMSAVSSREANKLLLDFMKGVEEGDELDVEYLRNGDIGKVTLSPRAAEFHAFSWATDGRKHQIDKIPGVPNIIRELKMERGFPFMGGAWGSMELVELNAGLGKYFGTDSGLLVVSAPKIDGLELQDGDVIRTIDGREPTGVRHAMRILSSYESGESLQLGIMRDKKRRTLDIEVPADHRGSLLAPPAVSPARAPMPAVPAVAPSPPADDVST